MKDTFFKVTANRSDGEFHHESVTGVSVEMVFQEVKDFAA
jgi:hypothetical protein